MTILPRSATVGEKTKIRSNYQSTRAFMTVHAPAVVYSATLAALPSSNDNVTSITYSGGSGPYTNILADMTLRVKSSLGVVLGYCRIRKTAGLGATSGTMNLGRTSEIVWSSGAILEVLDDFGIWPRLTSTSGSAIFMDTDVPYSDQHAKCLSFPIFPRYSVKWLVEGRAEVIRDGSLSWSLNNTINSYLWEAPGSVDLVGGTTAVATIGYSTANPTQGYRIGLTVGNTDGVSFTGYGRVFVLEDEDDAITQFTIESLSGSKSGGGWSATIRCWGQADRATIQDRALVILHRKDFYGLSATDEGSIGIVADDENIEMIGWIDGESIDWVSDGDAGSVTFTIYGPQHWLQNITVPSMGLKNLTHAPTNWKRFEGLTAKSATWHLLMWRSTAPRAIDCFPIENGWAALQIQSGGAQNIWQQLSNVMNDFLIGAPLCDAYARLHLQIEQNILTASERSSIPVVLDIEKQDWTGSFVLNRRPSHQVAGVDLIGELYNGTNEVTQIYSLSPGRAFSRSGNSIFSRTGLVLGPEAQTILNGRAGTIYGWQNNPYPSIPVYFPANLHLVDIAPYQYLRVDVAQEDTVRGIVQTDLKLIPTQIRRIFRDGHVDTEITFEGESLIYAGVTGDTPAVPPVIPPITPPIVYIPPTPYPTTQGGADEIWAAIPSTVLWSGDAFAGGDPTFNTLAKPSEVDIKYFGSAYQGTGVYVVDTSNVIWKLENLAEVRAAPSTAPIWTQILSTGTGIGYGNFGTASGFHMWGNHLIGFTQSSTGRRVHCDYDGSSWTFTNPANNYIDTLVGATRDFLTRNGQVSATVYRCTPARVGGVDQDCVSPVDFFGGGHGLGGHFPWQNLTQVAAYFSTAHVNHLGSGNTYTIVRRVTLGTYPTGTYEAAMTMAANPSARSKIRGAWNGPKTWIVDPNDGQLWIGVAGTSFAATGLTWNPSGGNVGVDVVMNTDLLGSGTFVWMTGNSTAGSEILRYSTNNTPSDFVNRTGNLGSLFSGAFSLVDMYLVWL